MGYATEANGFLSLDAYPIDVQQRPLQPHGYPLLRHVLLHLAHRELAEVKDTRRKHGIGLSLIHI